MRKDKRPLFVWDSSMTFLLIAAAIVLAVLLGGPRIMGAELPVRVGFPTAIDSARFIVAIDKSWSDSTAFGHAGVYNINDSVSYVDGDFVDVYIEFSYPGMDTTMVWHALSYNSAAASTLDSATVYAAVYDAAEDNPSLFLGGTGAGTYSVTVLTYDSTISQAIPGVKLVIWDVAQSAVQAGPVKTGVGGDTTFNLDVASYIYVATLHGYTFPAYDTNEVSGSQTDTIFGDQFDPGSPAGASFCRVYGWVSELRDTTTSLVRDIYVCFEPKGAVRNACDLTWPIIHSICAKTDADGYFSQDLLYSSCLLDADSDTTQYNITVQGTDIKKAITVPDASSYRVTWE